VAVPQSRDAKGSKRWRALVGGVLLEACEVVMPDGGTWVNQSDQSKTHMCLTELAVKRRRVVDLARPETGDRKEGKGRRNQSDQSKTHMSLAKVAGEEKAWRGSWRVRGRGLVDMWV
jgi:hypothetical protein